MVSEVFRGFQRFLEVFRGFQRFFKGPLRDPLRVPFFLSELRVVLPLIVLPLKTPANKCPEKSSGKIPGKILQNLYNKNPRHISAEGPGQTLSMPCRPPPTQRTLPLLVATIRVIGVNMLGQKSHRSEKSSRP